MCYIHHLYHFHIFLSTGTLTARHVRLENPTKPVRYQGVVSAMKEDYGYIERADVVDEICFLVAEATHISGGLKPGDDVDFCINTVNVSELIRQCIGFVVCWIVSMYHEYGIL